MISEDIRVGELTIRFLVEGKHSNESASIFELEVPPGARVPGPHSHDGYEETVYGVQGTLTWTVEGARRQLGPEDCFCVKRGEVHSFVNESDEPVKQLVIVTPAMIGPEYFRDVAEVINSGAPPDPAAVAAVMRRHGLTPAPPTP